MRITTGEVDDPQMQNPYSGAQAWIEGGRLKNHGDSASDILLQNGSDGP